MAIRLATCLFVISLVVRLADVERLFRQQQSIDLIPLAAKHLHNMVSSISLIVITIEDATPVLRTEIRTDSIRLGRVMNFEEQFAETLVRNQFGVKLYDYGLHMMSPVRPYVLIRRKSLLPASITCKGINHTRYLLKLMLSTPETAAGKNTDLNAIACRRMVKVNLRAISMAVCTISMPCHALPASPDRTFRAKNYASGH